MIELIILQGFAIVFIFCAGKMQSPAVDWIENVGAPVKVPRALHFWGAGVRFVFIVLCALAQWNRTGSIVEAGAAGLVCFLWIYLLFDIVVNADRPNRAWHYISINDGDGRRWVKWFGMGKAGKIKAFILFGAIVIFNVAYQILR